MIENDDVCHINWKSKDCTEPETSQGKSNILAEAAEEPFYLGTLLRNVTVR